MKIVVLNGSPRKGGNTEIMTQAFAEYHKPLPFTRQCAFPFALLHRPEFSRRKLWSFSIENISPSHQLRLYGLVHEC